MQVDTERPARVSLDCLDLGALGSVHGLSVTCLARIRQTPLHYDTCDDSDTCPSLANSKGGQQRQSQRRSDLLKVAHSISPITFPVGNALARWQLTTCRATRSGFISPYQTVGPTLVGMLLVGGLPGVGGCCEGVSRGLPPTHPVLGARCLTLFAVP